MNNQTNNLESESPSPFAVRQCQSCYEVKCNFFFSGPGSVSCDSCECNAQKASITDLSGEYCE